jgi:ketosteroid isomerase-like protein
MFPSLKTLSMKKIVITLGLFFCAQFLYSQNQQTETEIRNLEQAEVKAVLEKDSAMLLKLWDKDYVVNNPENMIVFPGKSTLDRPVLKRSRVSFTRNVEQVIVRGDVVFSMGSETVIATEDQQQAGQIISRRYTNIWMKKEAVWKLVARHANVICQSK